MVSSGTLQTKSDSAPAQYFVVNHTFHLLGEVYLEVPVHAGQNLLIPLHKHPALWLARIVAGNPSQARRLQLI